MEKDAKLIIGANSEIAKALACQITSNSSSQLIVVSRDVHFYQQSLFKQAKVMAVDNYQESEIANVVKHLSSSIHATISEVYVCHGLLHNHNCRPEKRLEDFSTEAFNEILQVNTITPMLWLKYLTPLLVGKIDCKIIIFSARVGSISDNEIGGWYSYRASKAAMNMLLKSAAVELARRAKNIKLISFHPGTTDSPLSKPFQKNVPKGKLFKSDYVAKQLLNIVEEVAVDGEASFFDWQGKEIPW